MKTLKFFITALMIMIANSFLFSKGNDQFIHVLHLIVAVVGMVFFILTFLNLEQNVYFKNYKIPMYFGLIIVLRSFESIISQYLGAYFPVFYEENKYYVLIVIGAFILSIILIYSKKTNSTSKVDE